MGSFTSPKRKHTALTRINEVGQPVTVQIDKIFEYEKWIFLTAKQFIVVSSKTALLALQPDTSLYTTEVNLANTIMITHLFTRLLLEILNNTVLEGFPQF